MCLSLTPINSYTISQFNIAQSSTWDYLYRRSSYHGTQVLSGSLYREACVNMFPSPVVACNLYTSTRENSLDKKRVRREKREKRREKREERRGKREERRGKKEDRRG